MRTSEKKADWIADFLRSTKKNYLVNINLITNLKKFLKTVKQLFLEKISHKDNTVLFDD